jgi:hypothetical protein
VEELQDCQTNCAEKEALEKVIETETQLPHFNFTWATGRILRKTQGDLKGKEILRVNSLPSNIRKCFSHILICSESLRSPGVTAIKIDSGNIIHKLNLLVPNMEVQ